MLLRTHPPAVPGVCLAATGTAPVREPPGPAGPRQANAALLAGLPLVRLPAGARTTAGSSTSTGPATDRGTIHAAGSGRRPARGYGSGPRTSPRRGSRCAVRPPARRSCATSCRASARPPAR
jgi:hypothetical protein